MPLDHQHEFFRRRGFRCIEPTTVRLLDGTEAVVQAQTYESTKERPDDTPRRKRALMLYELRFGDERELIDDLDLEERLGTEQYTQLPIVDLSVYAGKNVVIRDPESGTEHPGFLYPANREVARGQRYRILYPRKDATGTVSNREHFLDDADVAALEQRENGTPVFVLRRPLE